MPTLVEQSLRGQEAYPAAQPKRKAPALFASRSGELGSIGLAGSQEIVSVTSERGVSAGVTEFGPRPLMGPGGSWPSPLDCAVQVSLGAERSLRSTLFWLKDTLLSPMLGQSDLEVRKSFIVKQVKALLEEGAIDRARDLLQAQSAAIKADDRLSRLSLIVKPGRVEAHDVRGPDRRAEMAWIQSNASQYKGKWIAVLGDTLIASGDDLRTVIELIHEKGPETRPLIHHVV